MQEVGRGEMRGETGDEAQRDAGGGQEVRGGGVQEVGRGEMREVDRRQDAKECEKGATRTRASGGGDAEKSCPNRKRRQPDARPQKPPARQQRPAQAMRSHSLQARYIRKADRRPRDPHTNDKDDE